MHLINDKSTTPSNLLFKALILSVILIAAIVFMSRSAALAKNGNSNASEINTAKQLYVNFVAGDMAKVIDMFSEDVTLVFHGPEEIIPYAGTFKGKEGVTEFFNRINQTINVNLIDQRLYSREGNVVTVMGWEESTVKSTGGEFKANWVHVLTVENDLITRFEEITDSAAITQALAPADPARGEAFYTTCLGCHGTEGQGMVSMHAPRLTLQNSEYLTRQLRNFRHDVRGGVQDFYGWQMNGRAKALTSDRAIRDVLAYIDTLPDAYATDTVNGDISRGSELYERSCTACHGDKAQGNAALNAPQLAGMDGWYQIEQLTKFSNGLRGKHEKDLIGQTMAASVSALSEEQDMQDVTAYILSLEADE